VTAKLSSKGQIVIPLEIRRSNRLKAGDQLRFEQTERGILLRKPRKSRPQLVSDVGLLVLAPPKGTPPVTSRMVKRLEAELP